MFPTAKKQGAVLPAPINIAAVLLQALYVMSNRLDLVVAQPTNRFFVGTLARILAFAQEHDNVVLAQLGRLQVGPDFSATVRTVTHSALRLNHIRARILRPTYRNQEPKGS